MLCCAVLCTLLDLAIESPSPLSGARNLLDVPATHDRYPPSPFQFLREHNQKPQARETSIDRQSQSMWHQWQQRLKVEGAPAGGSGGGGAGSGGKGGGGSGDASGEVGGGGGHGGGDLSIALELVEHEPDAGCVHTSLFCREFAPAI